MLRITKPFVLTGVMALLFAAAGMPAFAQDELPDTPDVPEAVAGAYNPPQSDIQAPVVADQAPVQAPVQAAIGNQTLPNPASSNLSVSSVGTGSAGAPARFDGTVILLAALAVLAGWAAHASRPGVSRP